MDNEERLEILQRMLKEASVKYSNNFLAAHGLGKVKVWKTNETMNAFLVYRLDDVKYKIGLKSIYYR